MNGTRPAIMSGWRVSAAVASAPLAATALIAATTPQWPIVVLIGVAATLVALAATWRLVVAPLVGDAAHSRILAGDAAQELLAAHADRDLRDRLDATLERADSEAATLRYGLRAVAELLPDADVALLMSIPDEPRVGWKIVLHNGGLEPAMQVPGRPTCAALESGGVATTSTSTNLDACAHLSDPDVDVSATCLPLQVGERMLGSVCVTRAPGETVDADIASTLRWIVARTARRVADHRARRGPAISGHPDPLTGLAGSATLKSHLREMVRALTPFCVGVIAVDDIEQLRGDHGEHEADLAVCTTADVLVHTLRPDDLVCRIDDNRFGVVLADCEGVHAAAALERARESLALELAGTGGLRFTLSAGAVESQNASSLDELIEFAVEASATAALAGGNRVALYNNTLTERSS